MLFIAFVASTVSALGYGLFSNSYGSGGYGNGGYGGYGGYGKLVKFKNKGYKIIYEDIQNLWESKLT